MLTKLLLSCDDYIYIYKGNTYASISGKPDFFERYLRVFDSVRIVARSKVVFDPPEETFVKIDNDRIEIWEVPFFRGPIQFIKSYLRIQKSLRDVTVGCDVAILRLPSTTAYQVLNFVLKNKLPFAIEVVANPYDSIRTSQTLMNKYYYKSWDKDLLKACRFADGISCVTEKYMQKRYFPLKQNSFTAHYSSIALPLSSYSSPKNFPQKQTLQVLHVANHIIYGGTKGHKELIEAASIVIAKGFKINVVFVGKNNNNGIEKLNTLAKEFGIAEIVTFLGYQKTSQDLLNIINQSDIFVLPTKSEGLPRSIIEAMSQGLPCVSTNISGNSELIENDFLIPNYNDIELLAHKIIILLSNPEVYESSSKRNFERSKNYEMTILQNKRDEFYTRLKERVSPPH
ncbi:MAG: glycosyltransferase [Paludibacter sp.]|nr:glycosyltransferase [Paludibacter sp.]